MYTLVRYNKQSFVKKKCRNNYLKQIKKFKYSTASSSGRSLVNALINELNFNEKDKVLLPSYSPEGITAPFKKNRIEIIYYKLNKNLEPDKNFIKKKIYNIKNIKLFVKIHNMGFYKNDKTLLKILKLNKIFILEDLAQSCSTQNIKINKFDYGKSFYLFSLNKILPVTDGAFLTSNNSDIVNTINLKKRLKPNYKSISYYSKHINNNNKIADSLSISRVRNYINKSNEYYDKYYKLIKNDFALREISTNTLNILLRIDMNNLFKQRIENYDFLVSQIKSSKFQLLKDTNSSIAPMALPLIVKGSRLKLYNKLFKNYVLAAVQKDRWNFNYINLFKNTFKNEFNYINNHLLITVDEGYNKNDMNNIINILNNI